MEGEDLGLSSTFPQPPAHHLKFTSANLRLLGLLRDHPARPLSLDKGKQREVLLIDLESQDQNGERIQEPDLPDWDFNELEPPKLDWIEKDETYECFGDVFPVNARVPTIEDMGVPRLIPDDVTNMKPHLLSLLHTYLRTTLLLLGALTRPPSVLAGSEDEQTAPVGAPYVERLEQVGVNMMVGVNGLRGVQAQATLEQIMVDQLQRRRSETADAKRKCAELSNKLASLKALAAEQSALSQTPASVDASSFSTTSPSTIQTIEDREKDMLDLLDSL
ncbi:Transcriptional coactivator [Phaffia rhodozyma]|uniref:Mediator of RNA polymerase II transcription subunit 7 n=1 Tax=Phaffia rhodozyma TaxID=264483 RepID=A0A0F7SJ13_PHARH|nr:Transcriptional coactivator [Phaffia rhodozyma]